METGTERARDRAGKLHLTAFVLCTLVLAAMSFVLSCGSAYATPTLDSISGDDRYETSANIAEEAFPDGVESGYAVLVNGTDSGWPDALAASSLAGALEGPVLLTMQSDLPDDIAEVIESLGIEDVIIVGGTNSVSEDVATELANLGVSVDRIYGGSRYDTQAGVYEYGVKQGYWDSTIFVASGNTYADALSVSSIAYSQCIPIFLVNGSSGFSDKQVEYLFDGSITTAYLLGGTSSVPYFVEKYMVGVTRINAISQSESGSSSAASVTRIYGGDGGDRYDTSLAIAEWAVKSGYASWDYAAFVSGTKAADALSASALQGSDGSVILLVANANSVTIDGIEEHAGKVTTCVRVIGGTSSVSSSTRQAIREALDIDDYEIMGESEVTVDQMVACYEATGHEYPSEELGDGGASTIEKFCEILYEEAETEGVKAEVVFAQSMIETGWLQFGGDVDISQYNFAGIGAVGGGASGASFDNVRQGLRAQVQHLKAYASTDDLVNDCVDPRFDLVTRGCATTVQGLSGRWAASETYGDQIVELIYKVKSY